MREFFAGIYWDTISGINSVLISILRTPLCVFYNLCTYSMNVNNSGILIRILFWTKVCFLFIMNHLTFLCCHFFLFVYMGVFSLILHTYFKCIETSCLPIFFLMKEDVTLIKVYTQCSFKQLRTRLFPYASTHKFIKPCILRKDATDCLYTVNFQIM